MKQTLRVIGVQVTKQSFAKTVSKVVPVVGGGISGSLTFLTLNTQSNRLMNHLRELPPPNMEAETYLAAVKLADEAAGTRGNRFETALDEIGTSIKGTASTVAQAVRSVDPVGQVRVASSKPVAQAKNFGEALAETASDVGSNITGFFRMRKTRQRGEDKPSVKDSQHERSD